MAISDIPILSMLRTRMHWHQERQRLLAENVANSDTPGFRPRDLAPLKLEGRSAVTLARTQVAHVGALSSGSPGGAAAFRAVARGHEVPPTGNAVNLEDQMLKVAANQMDHQAASALYARSLALLKTALGRK